MTMFNSGQKQQGSALVETSVLMVVLLPLIYGVVMLGKVIDLTQTTEQASRYAAWESTVYTAAGSNGAAPAGITERFFGAPTASLQTQSTEPGNNRLWGNTQTPTANRYEKDTRVAIKSQAITADYQRDIAEPTAAMVVGELAGKSGEILDGLSGNSWGLTANGLVQANVGVEMDGSAWLNAGATSCGSDQSSLCLKSSAVILVDGWSASNDAHSEERVRSLMPASAIEPLGDAISLVGNIPMFGELKGLKGAFGHVDMQVLPEYAKP